MELVYNELDGLKESRLMANTEVLQIAGIVVYNDVRWVVKSGQNKLHASVVVIVNRCLRVYSTFTRILTRIHTGKHT